MPTRNFSGRAQATNAPANRLAVVVPSDDTDLPDGLARGLFVGGAGTLRVVDSHGNIADIVSNASQYHPLRIARIMATGTTAADIVALY
jgi:hypothetical protein